MVRIDGEIVIDRPVEEVFDFVAGPNNGGVFGDPGKSPEVDPWVQAQDVVAADSGLIVVGWDSVDDQAAVWRATPTASPSAGSG